MGYVTHERHNPNVNVTAWTMIIIVNNYLRVQQYKNNHRILPCNNFSFEHYMTGLSLGRA